MTKLTGISPKVPLVYDSTDGPYQLNKNLRQTVKQNLKMLLLTSPGERIMFPNFGVGLHNFLFENIGQEALSTLATRTKKQIDFYMPAVKVIQIKFFTNEDDPSIGLNEVIMVINYTISPYNVNDQLAIPLNTTN